MLNNNSHYIQLDGWIFEIKTVKAIRAQHYGEPYNAIANFTIQHDKAYIDGLMTKTEDDFSHEDRKTFNQFFSQLGVKQVSFERYSKDMSKKSVTKNAVPTRMEDNVYKLVR